MCFSTNIFHTSSPVFQSRPAQMISNGQPSFRRQPDDFAQRRLRFEFHEAFQFFHERFAAAHVVKARRIRPVVGNQSDPGFRAERFHDEPREFEHGNFLRAADVENLTARLRQSCKRTSASTTSFTRQKQRVCLPSPKTFSGSFFFAAAMKRGKTIPYRPVCFGPTVLKSRAMVTGSFFSRA